MAVVFAGTFGEQRLLDAHFINVARLLPPTVPEKTWVPTPLYSAECLLGVDALPVNTGICEKNGGPRKMYALTFLSFDHLYPERNDLMNLMPASEFPDCLNFVVKNCNCSKHPQAFWTNPPGQNKGETYIYIYILGSFGNFPAVFFANTGSPVLNTFVM